MVYLRNGVRGVWCWIGGGDDCDDDDDDDES
jgi:hypothetical protein